MISRLCVTASPPSPSLSPVRLARGLKASGVLRRGLWLLALLALLLPAVACGPGPEEVAADQNEIKAAVEAYLPQLAEAYATGNIEVLRGHAVEKELASVDKVVGELAAEGRVLKPELKSVTFEQVEIWNKANAYVTTLEVWDIYNYAAGSDVVLSEAIDKAHRVRYQLKERPDGWQVLYRQVEQIYE